MAEPLQTQAGEWRPRDARAPRLLSRVCARCRGPRGPPPPPGAGAQRPRAEVWSLLRPWGLGTPQAGQAQGLASGSSVLVRPGGPVDAPPSPGISPAPRCTHRPLPERGLRRLTAWRAPQPPGAGPGPLMAPAQPRPFALVPSRLRTCFRLAELQAGQLLFVRRGLRIPESRMHSRGRGVQLQGWERGPRTRTEVPQGINGPCTQRSLCIHIWGPNFWVGFRKA